MNFREKIAPYSALAKILLALMSAALITYGIYDAATLTALVGTLTAIATAFWEGYDRANPR